MKLKFEWKIQVGVAGRTGCGKSTLMMALYRIVEPSSGRVVIDGIDVSSIGLADLRTRLALVPQVDPQALLVFVANPKRQYVYCFEDCLCLLAVRALHFRQAFEVSVAY